MSPVLLRPSSISSLCGLARVKKDAPKVLSNQLARKTSAANVAAGATEGPTTNTNQRIIPYFQQINNQFVPTTQNVATAGQRAAAVAATAAYPQVTFQTAAPTAAAVAAAAAQPNWNEVRLNVGRLEYATGGKVVGYKSVIETHIQSQLEKQHQQQQAAAQAGASQVHVLAAGSVAALGGVGVTGAIPGGEHKCKKCELHFAQKTQLRSHVRAAHMKPRTFACEHCGKMFCSKHNKEVHVDSVHLKITHKCQYCGKVFTQKNNLFSHVKSEHGGGVKR